jgi:hypothetical protein
MNEQQYSLIFARRQNQDNLVWQTPAFAIAAEAFLLTASFSNATSRRSAILLAAFGVMVALGSLQRMSRHRFLESLDAKLLSQFELENAEKGFSHIHKKPEQMGTSLSAMIARSYRIWMAILWGLCLLATYATVDATMYHS